MRFAVLFLVGALLGLRLAAHPVLTEAMSAQITPEAVIVRLQPSAQVIRAAAGLPEEPRWSEEEWQAAAEKFSVYLLEHLAVAADGQRLQGRVTFAQLPGRAALTAGNLEKTLGAWEVRYELPEASRKGPVVHLRHRLLTDRAYGEGVRWQLSFLLSHRTSPTAPWLLQPLPPEATFLLAATLPSPLPPDPLTTW